MVHKILGTVRSLEESNIKLKIFWVPSHSSILGNELADKLAK